MEPAADLIHSVLQNYAWQASGKIPEVVGSYARQKHLTIIGTDVNE